MEVISECAIEHTGLQANNELKLFLNEYSFFNRLLGRSQAGSNAEKNS